MNPLLECRKIRKAFAGVRVLKDVDLQLASGQVLGLVGENGAGKSTMMNILGGVLPADDGAMLLSGTPYAPRNPAQAAAAGVRIVHQELNLFPNLSVAENLFLDRIPRAPWGIRRTTLSNQSREILRQVNLDRDPWTPVAQLSTGERQLVEIAKALGAGAKLIVFDEPTTSLTQPEAARLFAIIDNLRGRGLGVIYISHQLDDVLRLANDVLVLRDGVRQACGPAQAFTIPLLIQQMIGRELDHVFPERRAAIGEEIVLQLRNVSRRGVVDDVSLEVRSGEILGIAGMMGAGRSELARLAFGLDPLDAGTVQLGGDMLAVPTPARTVKKGVALITEDRRDDGLLLNASVDDNMLLASWRDHACAGWLRRRAAKRAAAAMADSLKIGGALDRPVVQLSGGNQQKAIFARWLLRKPRCLILDEPTRGVDVGAKDEIYRLIRRLTDAGTAILLISSEIEELLGLADRVAVMRAGRMVGEFARAEFDRERVLACALGQEALA